MKEIIIRGGEMYNPDTGSFTKEEDKSYFIKHTLKSLTRYEEITRLHLLDNTLTYDQWVLYIHLMAVGEPIPKDLITVEVIKEVSDYMADTPSATKLSKLDDKEGSGNFISSEVIYSYMAINKIPFECDEWNLNKLLMLLAVNARHRAGPTKKKSAQEVYEYNKRLNESRLARMKK